MRDFPSCYGEYGVQVSDSSARTNKTARNLVTCIYQAQILGRPHTINITWSKTLMGQVLSMGIDGFSNRCLCKVEIKQWLFSKRKGSKSVDVENNKIRFGFGLSPNVSPLFFSPRLYPFPAPLRMALALTRSFVAPPLPSGVRSPPPRHRTRARGLSFPSSIGASRNPRQAFRSHLPAGHSASSGLLGFRWVGAGTMNPLTFLRVLGPEPWNVAYAEPSVRPDDSRYGDNPNRLQCHTQFQVILKPDPGNSQDLFLGSLSALGINVNEHDIRFVEDNWESPVLGAWGLGWEIWMDGMEITQFTYFQQAGSLPLLPISVEITYGLERILMLLQGVNHFKKIQYSDGITYGELFLENEKEMSAYYLEHANIDHIQQCFENFEEEAQSLLALELPIPAYDQLLKASHAFNILDSRGFVGVTERARYFGRMRSLARQCAQLWVKTRETLGHPLGISLEGNHLMFQKFSNSGSKKVMEQPGAFVLEIGTEEMPPHDVIEASNQLKNLTIELLAKRRLSHGKVSAYGTPRRLVIFVESLSHKQAENEVEVRGPPAAKAFDSDGTPTKAAEGFCRKNCVAIGCLYKKFEGKTEYVYVKVKESAQSAFEVLIEDLPSILTKISFPKSMRWNSQVMFSRPIRWILALHGDVVLPFAFAGVSSGRQSCGLRNSSSAILEVESAESYLHKMMEAGLLINIEARKEKILCDVDSLAASIGGYIIMQSSLVEEVVNLVEAPVAILGRFDESFLDLPKDILIMVMQKHQKYFPLINKHSGNLMPFFIAVANGIINEQVVQKGNEAVLRARYEDAKFFYKMDTRKKFSEFRGLLSGILFHEKLGTMLDKVSRIQRTVGKLTLALGFDERVLMIVEDAAALAMSDLASSIVTEFTSLSGIMARHYALRDGYPEQIAEALFEIALPRFSGDILPKSDAGIVLAIADRLDSLVGLFGAGCQPSSTSDPFGLRRISYGLVQIVVENNKNLYLEDALRLVADIQPIEIDGSVITDVLKFVTRRLEQLLVDKGISPEIVRSVLSERANWPCLAAQSAIEMEALSKGEIFSKVVQAYSRPTRIIRGKNIDSSFEVSEAAFERNEELALWSAYLEVTSKVHHGINMDSFFQASLLLLQPLEDFFNNVFVMVEDETIKNNRLAILKKIADLPKGIADLSVLPGF
ncbi:Glycyl-tRNA synthetase alpha subunit [Musa troglodytarum]|uniref:glycine--tRNA ligase n=1 Tax=Musa troglodytarum TaxID=320322 RepID=A0A9E7F7M0_9LILI|nr:Glycyl-tRNA synthetase alpha subunit [Musa troglodytarum]